MSISAYVRLYTAKVLCWLGALIILLSFCQANVFAEQLTLAGQLTLAWDSSTDPNVAGYRLYYGQSSGNYISNVDVGNQTTHTLSYLENGKTYYFAATAYDTTGTVESDFSNEVSHTIPIPTALEANFSASPTIGTASLLVNFTDTSMGDISNWSWNFGDGGTSSAQNPSHNYAITGTYTVTLTATGPGGSNTKTQTNYIEVLSVPTVTAGFSANPTSGTAPLLVNFTDTSLGDISAWSWDFGDGGTASGQIAIKSYTDPGTYTVSLTVTGSVGSSETVTKTNLISVTATPPMADFSASPTSGIAPLLVNFTDTSTGDISTWSWDFGDGGTSTARNPSYSYTEAGTYTVTLNVTGPGGSDVKTQTGYITVSSSSSSRVTDGQLVLYAFEEGSGDTIRDISGVGTPLDLTVSDPGAVYWLPGGGMAIDAATAIKSAGPATKVRTALQASQALTIEAWVAPDNTTQGGPARIVALSLDGNSGGNFVMGQNETQYLTRLRTSTTNQYGQPSLATSTGMVTTDLTHLVYTRDATGTCRFYINGIEEASGAVAGNFSGWGDYALALANEPAIDNNGEDRPWLGELHLVALYDRALDTAEVNLNFAAGPDMELMEGIARSSASCIWWRCTTAPWKQRRSTSISPPGPIWSHRSNYSISLGNDF